MSVLDFAAPNGVRAQALRRECDQRLVRSLSYLVERGASGGIEVQLVRKALERVNLDVPDSNIRLAPLAYELHDLFRVALIAGNRRSVRAVVSLLADADLVRSETEIRVFRDDPRSIGDALTDDDVFQLVMEAEYDATYDSGFDVGRPQPQAAERSGHAIRAALAVLDRCDPLMAREVESIVTEFTLLQSPEIRAGTSVRSFGRVWLRVLREDQPWQSYVERIVHETSHLFLYLLWIEDPIVRNASDGGFYSPLRSELRPLSALFHGMFVLARTIRTIGVLRRALDVGFDVRYFDATDNNALNPAPFEEKFQDLVATIRSSANLTPVGSRVLDSCCAMVEAASEG